MNNLITRLTFLFLIIGFYTQAQCPIGIEATIINVTDVGGGNCSFDLELFYATGSANNSSIQFTVAIKDGPVLYTSACFESLKNNASPFTFVLSDASLVANCSSEIGVTYDAWTSPMCNGGSGCAPVDNSVPVLGSLPVEFISFDAYLEKPNKIKLDWVTASEEDNAMFSLERSADGRNFEEIGTVEGNNTSIAINYYSFIDEFPLKGDNYYRLKQIDFNNTFAYSEVVIIEFKADRSSPITLAPSVAINNLNIVFNELPKEHSMIEVFDSKGVNMINTSLDDSSSLLNLDISSYAPGMYFIRVPIGTEYVVKRFIKVAD